MALINDSDSESDINLRILGYFNARSNSSKISGYNKSPARPFSINLKLSKSALMRN